MLMLRNFSIISALLLLSGCGMRGQLVLPEELLFLNIFL